MGAFLVLGCLQPAGASASYPGRDGAIVYELNGTWNAGNLGSCNNCGGGLSGIYRLATAVKAKPIDDCLYATGPVRLCGGGRPLRQCNFQSYGDEICGLYHPAFSPDGRSLVYAWTGERPCQFDYGYCQPPGHARNTLVIASANGSHPSPLPPLTASDTQPAFRPDGQIVFTGTEPAGHGTDLFVVTSAGTGLQRLTDNGASQPAPCANGTIAYVHAGNLYLLARHGHSARRLTRAGGHSPDCAPDGRSVAFVRGGRVYLVRVSDRRVIGPIGPRIGSGPTFSPTGRLLAVTVSDPVHPSCNQIEICSIDYLETITLTGRRQGRAYRIADTGVDDGDGGGHGVVPGAIAWQP